MIKKKMVLLFLISIILSNSDLIFFLDASKSVAATSSSSDSSGFKKNPFTSQQDPSRITKNSFRIYIDSISKAQFDIIVAASNEIAWTLEISSGFRQTSFGPLRMNEQITVLQKTPEFIKLHGIFKEGFIIRKTEFLEVSDKKIIIKVIFVSMEKKPTIEVFDVFTFKKDEKGWFFFGYSDAGIDYPCVRPKVWKEKTLPCSVFQR